MRKKYQTRQILNKIKRNTKTRIIYEHILNVLTEKKINEYTKMIIQY